MRRCLTLMLFLLFVTGPFVSAQDAQSSGGAADITGAHPVLTATGVALDDVVISISGFCDRALLVEGAIAPPSPTSASKPDQANPQNKGEAAAGPNAARTKDADCKTEVTRAQFERLTDALGIGQDHSNRIRTAVRYPEVLLYRRKHRSWDLRRIQGSKKE